LPGNTLHILLCKPNRTKARLNVRITKMEHK
jgi:hypothetical protein